MENTKDYSEFVKRLKPHQVDGLYEFIKWFNGRKQFGILAGCGGSGKQNPLSEPILTPNGWTTMGNIKVGSQVIGADGKPTDVLAIYPSDGEVDIFKVTFADGSSSRCSADHLWAVSTVKQVTRGDYYVKPLKEIMLDYKTGKPDHPYKYSIQGVAAIEVGNYNPHAYAIGYVLGNGTVKHAKNRLRVTTHYADYEEIVKLLSPSLGLPAHTYNPNGTLAMHLDYPWVNVPESMLFLRDDKPFPDPLSFDIASRYELLRGLMDADGSVDARHIRFSNKNESYIDGIISLVRSLGGRVTKTEGKIRMNKAKKDGTVTPEWDIPLRTPECCFKLDRKAYKWNRLNTYQGFRYSIVNIEYDGKEKAQCIAVDHPQHLYVAGDYKLTHNTHSIMIYAEAVGLAFDDILACAPTNAAAKKLGESMGIDAASIHSTYTISPVKAEWTQEHQDEYNKVIEELADDSIDHDLRSERTKDELVLKIKSKAASANELVFLPKNETKISDVKLIVIDEASMVSKEVSSWIEAFTDPKVKVLFMGDEKQLPPVDDGDQISPAFAYHQIAKFEHSVRSEAGSSLYKLIDKIRHIEEPKSQIAVLEMLDDPDNVMTIGEDEAVLVSGKRKRQLVEHFAKTLKPDGLEWRILAYRNATVDNWNHAAKVGTGTPYFGLGDTMVARSGFSRYGLFDEYQIVKDKKTGKERAAKSPKWKPFKLLENGARVDLGNFHTSVKMQTGLLKDDYFEYQKYGYTSCDYAVGGDAVLEIGGYRTVEPNPDIFNCGFLKRYLQGMSPDDKAVPKGDINTWFLNEMVVISPKDLPKYKAACEYWTKLSKSFGMATKNPEASDTIREFMESTMSVVLDISLDKPKPIKEWFAVKVGGTSNLVRLKKYCARVSQSLNNLTDDIVYPFAGTIHRSQGQTIDNVLFDVTDVGTINFGSKDLLCRAIYTGVSRAAKRLIVLM